MSVAVVEKQENNFEETSDHELLRKLSLEIVSEVEKAVFTRIKEEIEDISMHVLESSEVNEDYTVNVNKLGEEDVGSNDPFMVSVKLNGIKTDMELDTGAAVSVTSADQYNKLGGEPLKQSRLKLKTCTGEIVRPIGIGFLNVEYRKIKLRLPITVVEGPVPTLLGRN